MSLRIKFGVLLGLLGLSVFLALSASWWAMRNMQTQLRDPISSMTDALTALGSAKRAVQSARNVFDPEFTTDPQERPGVSQALSSAAQYIETLSADEWARTRIGSSTIVNLRTRLRVAISLSDTPPSVTDDETIRQVLYDLYELVQRTESRVVEDTQQALSFGSALERQLHMILGLCLIIAALGIALGVSLVRRWVLGPIARLRVAAARIGSGDLAHRVPIPAGKPDELALLSAEVNTMAGLVKSLQDKRVESERLAAIGEMVRRLAHNLRNPLAGIRGLAEITRADLRARTPAEPELTENQDRIIAAVDRFENWLNELLGVTRPMQVAPAPTRVEPWLKGLLAAHQPQAQAKAIRLITDLSGAPELASFDARHLEHAVSAVLSNAIEAVGAPPPPGAPARTAQVRVACGESADAWFIEITDSGPGVPAEIQDKIFRPYFTTKRDGNGIGLAIALQVVQAHAGRMMVTSPAPVPETLDSATPDRNPPARGTCFRIELPKIRPVLANESELNLATIGQIGAASGQDSRHRG